MSKRKESATWKGPTHAFVKFDNEDSTAVVPLKKIRLTGAEQVKVGCSYPVKWTDSKIYKATVHALGSSSEMQDTIDALVSSDDNDHLQVDEEDSDYSTKDDKALVSPSFEDTAADRGLELDTSTQSCEPEVNIDKKYTAATSKSKELLRAGDEILKKLRTRSPVTHEISTTTSIRTWDGLSFEEAVMKKLDNLEKQLYPSQPTSRNRREDELLHIVGNSSPTTSCVPKGKRLFSSPAGCSTEEFKNDSSPSQNADRQREGKGCWLGNPNSHLEEKQKVWIPLGDPGKVDMAETISKNAQRLAVNLLSVFFTREKLASGNCTPAPNRELLDQKIIQGIRLHLKHIYPMTTTKDEEERWKKIVQTSMNAKCRNNRAALKFEAQIRRSTECGPKDCSAETSSDLD